MYVNAEAAAYGGCENGCEGARIMNQVAMLATLLPALNGDNGGGGGDRKDSGDTITVSIALFVSVVVGLGLAVLLAVVQSVRLGRRGTGYNPLRDMVDAAAHGTNPPG